jgi:sarcosine oxidase subunit alpha
MAQNYRLKDRGRVDLDRPIDFTYNGKRYRGYAGDTVASALLANGVHLVGRSFKYHRPRGILGAGAEEPNALLQVESGARTLPNVRATQAELYDGMSVTSARSTSCSPSCSRPASTTRPSCGRRKPGRPTRR